MGFGLLFIGYFLALPTASAFFYTLIPACVFFAVACRKLSRVNVPFIRAFYVSCALIPAALTACILRLIPAVVWIVPYFEAALLVGWIIWHLFVLTGIEWVAQETGLSKLRFKAFRNKVFTCIYLIPAVGLTLLDVVSPILPKDGQTPYIIAGLNIAVMVFGLVVLLLNLLVIYTAYARICMPEDKDMPQKPSRFEFINRRRAEQDKREAENAALLEEMKERRRQRRNNQKNKKQK